MRLWLNHWTITIILSTRELANPRILKIICFVFRFYVSALWAPYYMSAFGIITGVIRRNISADCCNTYCSTLHSVHLLINVGLKQYTSQQKRCWAFLFIISFVGWFSVDHIAIWWTALQQRPRKSQLRFRMNEISSAFENQLRPLSFTFTSKHRTNYHAQHFIVIIIIILSHHSGYFEFL